MSFKNRSKQGAFFYFIKTLTPLWRFSFSVIILGGAWYGFLYLSGNPPFDPTFALIMVWSSVIVLILTIYPNILQRIKRVKIKDFEIELNEALTPDKLEDFITLPDQQENLMGSKGDFSALYGLIQQAKQEPHKQILLKVNIGSSQITIPHLYIYLLAFRIFDLSSITIFVNSENRKSAHIQQNEVIGAISGEKAWNILKDYSSLQGNPKFHELVRQIISLHRDGIQDIHLFEELWHYSRDFSSDFIILNKQQVLTLFGNLFISTITNYPHLTEDELSVLQKSLNSKEEYLILLDGNYLSSILVLDNLSRNLAIKVLEILKDRQNN